MFAPDGRYGFRAGYTDCLRERAIPAEQRLAAITAEHEALQREILTAQVFTRVVEWLKDPDRKPATQAFTASMERQICYVLEMDVLPAVKNKEIQLRNAIAQRDELIRLGQDLVASMGKVAAFSGPARQEEATARVDRWLAATHKMMKP